MFVHRCAALPATGFIKNILTYVNKSGNSTWKGFCFNTSWQMWKQFAPPLRRSHTPVAYKSALSSAEQRSNIEPRQRTLWRCNLRVNRNHSAIADAAAILWVIVAEVGEASLKATADLLMLQFASACFRGRAFVLMDMVEDFSPKCRRHKISLFHA